MNRNRIAAALAAALFVLSVNTLRADVRADEKTHVEFAGMLGRMVNLFGGKGAREGITSSVAVKGDRKARMTEQTGQIIDLAEEKVYDLDLRKKSYKVTTFAELRRKMEEAQKKAEENARKQDGKKDAPADKENQKQMEVDVSVKNTGERKTINGFETREQVVTVTVREKGKTLEESGGMVMTTDMWMAPRIAAMKEIAEFDMRYAQKLYGPALADVSAEQMAMAMAMYPQMKQAMGRMTTEGAKLDGTAILTTVTMDAVKSAEQMADEAKQKDDDSKSSASGGMGGMLGGFAKKMAAKRAGGGGDDENKARGTFMTSTIEVLKVDTSVSAADLAVPAGFKENK
jgi:hypothetical protein